MEDDGKIFPFSNTGFIYANGFTWNRIIFVNKLDVSDTLQLTVQSVIGDFFVIL